MGKHPSDQGAQKLDRRGGPEVMFHTSFPKPGLYKVWGQFKRNGNVLTIPFVLQVR